MQDFHHRRRTSVRPALTGAPPPNSATWFSWTCRKPKACQRQGARPDASLADYGFDSNIIGTNSYDETKDSDVVVITAGIARKPA